MSAAGRINLHVTSVSPPAPTCCVTLPAFIRLLAEEAILPEVSHHLTSAAKMSYISASGQIERGPDSVPSTSEARPRKRAKTADDDDDDGGDNPSPSAFAKPPDWIKSFYKRYQKLDKYALAAKVDLVDCDPAATTFTNHLVKKCEAAAPDDVPHLMHTFSDFLGRCVECDDADWTKCSHPEWASPPVYEVHNMPGKSCQVPPR